MKPGNELEVAGFVHLPACRSLSTNVVLNSLNAVLEAELEMRPSPVRRRRPGPPAERVAGLGAKWLALETSWRCACGPHGKTQRSFQPGWVSPPSLDLLSISILLARTPWRLSLRQSLRHASPRSLPTVTTG